MIPFYPEGTTLAAIIRTSIQLGQSKIFPHAPSRLLHGWGIKAVTENCLSPLEDCGLALRKYTAAPILFALRTAGDAEKLESLLLQGNPPRIGTTDVLPVAASVRRCPLCVAVDLQKIGITCARVLHQLANVAHCPLHNVPLEEKCSACGTCYVDLVCDQNGVIQETYGLERCRLCGCTEGAPLKLPSSATYKTFVDLLVDAFGPRAVRLRPKSRLHLVETAAFYAAKEGVDITSAFASEWEMDSFESAASACGASPLLLKRTLSGTGLCNEPASALASLAFSLSFLSARKIQYESEFSELGWAVKRPDTDNDLLRRRLWSVGREHGVPQYLMNHFSEGRGRTVAWGSSSCFDTLPAGIADRDREELERRRSEHLARRRERCGEGKRQRDSQRTRVLEYVSSHLGSAPDSRPIRQRILLGNPALYAWMRKNDTEWFDTHAPTRRSKNWYHRDLNASIERARKMILELGVGSLTDLHSKNYALYSWSQKHDQHWLRNHFSRSASATVSLERARQVIDNAVRTGVSVSAFGRKNMGVYLWALKNDRDWLWHAFGRDGDPPPIRSITRRAAELTLEQARKIVEDANVSSRTELHKMEKTVYVWLLKHDRDWLFNFLPSCSRSKDRHSLTSERLT